MVGKLAAEMMADSASEDLRVFLAEQDDRLVGCIMFSRLRFQTEIAAFILSPVAVHSGCQGQGIGQLLIRYGLGQLQEESVQFVVTYGDPAFYGKLGFGALSPQAVIPPHPLTQPEGWLGLTLAGDKIVELPGHSACVSALDNPDYW